MKSSEARNDEF